LGAGVVRTTATGMGAAGYVVQIVAIWGDIMTCIYRMAHRGALYDFDFAKFHRGIMARLEDWEASLPDRLSATSRQSVMIEMEREGGGEEEEEVASFALMHMVYRMALIKLHRHVHPRLLASAALRAQHARAAREHAGRLLSLWCDMARSGVGGALFASWHPFTISALLEAADVLTAEGACADLDRLCQDLRMAWTAATAVGASWAEAQAHGLALDRRLCQMERVQDRFRDGRASPGTASDPRVFMRDYDAAAADSRLPAGYCWQMADPVEARFPRDMDTVYNSRTPLPLQQQHTV